VFERVAVVKSDLMRDTASALQVAVCYDVLQRVEVIKNALMIHLYRYIYVYI